MTFGERLKTKRRERGDSREAAATKIGVSFVTLRNYERGATRPVGGVDEELPRRLRVLAEYTDMSVLQLLEACGIIDAETRSRYEGEGDDTLSPTRSLLNSPHADQRRVA